MDMYYNNKHRSLLLPKGGEYYPNEDMILLRGVADFLLNTGVIFTDETRPIRPVVGAGQK